MKVQELLDQLANCDLDADVEVIYCGSTWARDGECSYETDKAEWGAVDGVAQKEKVVRIYAQVEDLKDVL